MPIKKKTTTAPKSVSKSKSNTPHIQPSMVGIKAKSLVGLHDNIEKLKKAKSAMEDDPTRGELLSKARELAIKERMGSFYVDLPDNKSLLVKPSTRRYPLSDVAAERVEEIIDDPNMLLQHTSSLSMNMWWHACEHPYPSGLL